MSVFHTKGCISCSMVLKCDNSDCWLSSGCTSGCTRPGGATPRGRETLLLIVVVVVRVVVPVNPLLLSRWWPPSNNPGKADSTRALALLACVGGWVGEPGQEHTPAGRIHMARHHQWQ